MNIKEAKEQIKNAMTAYFTKDELGNYMIPIEKQRPVFLMGPPGVGKTAVMEQVAAEMGVGLLSYSMTHHTRQSALGLPFIVHKNYGGEEFDVSEYTMSEIISAVYELMEETGAVGINCNHVYASRTLSNTLHNNGYKLSVWTVDKHYQMKRALINKPDNITTHYPHKVEETIKNWGK